MKGQTMKKRASLILKIAAIVFLIIRLGGYVVADKRGKDFANQSTKNEGAKRMYKKLTTNMMVEDVNRTVDFYSDVLGFEFVMGVPQDSQEIVTAKQKGQPLGFAIVKCGDVDPEFNGMKIGGSLTFYVEVENIEGLYVKLKDKVTIIKDIQTTFYGKREFYLRDCNGYILIFAGDV
ncbi:MAG: VOC family protein [Planctomycetota bacterium]|jgi:uncharacterized glyoxalase superfamily protein PhnB